MNADEHGYQCNGCSAALMQTCMFLTSVQLKTRQTVNNK